MKSIIKISKNGSISKISSNIPDDITGISYSPQEKSVIFFNSSTGGVGFIKDNGEIESVPRSFDVPNPSGICCDEWGIAVFQSNEDMLWNFNQSFSNGVRLCGKKLFNDVVHNLQDVDKYVPCQMCRTSKSTILIALPWRHKVFQFINGNVGKSYGSGSNGFLSSSSSQSARFNNPSGVCFDKTSGNLFLSDTGNAIIRVFRGEKECAFLGVPEQIGAIDGIGTSARFNKPSAIVTKNGMVAVVDGNLVRTFDTASLTVKTVYASSRKIIALAMGADCIYVFEENL
jgi:hypothetical protein